MRAFTDHCVVGVEANEERCRQMVERSLAPAAALAPHNIRVNCVVPGPVLAPADAEAMFERVAERLPLGHAGTPEHVGHACLFLAENDFGTGTILRVDGGEGFARY